MDLNKKKKGGKKEKRVSCQDLKTFRKKMFKNAVNHYCLKC